MATEDLVKLRKTFVELMKVRDDDGKPLTQEAMAERLNKKKVPSFSGNPWSKYAVRRMLKRLDLNATGSSRSRGAAAAMGNVQATAEQVALAALSDNSPLRQWAFYESIRSVFDELTSGEYTEQGLADELNQRGITTADKKPWDEKSVSRAMTALRSAANASPALLALETIPAGELLTDDQVRDRIKAGYYDTGKVRFVAVAAKGAKAKKQPPPPPEPVEEKVEEKVEAKAGKKGKKGGKKKGKKKK